MGLRQATQPSAQGEYSASQQHREQKGRSGASGSSEEDAALPCPAPPYPTGPAGSVPTAWTASPRDGHASGCPPSAGPCISRQRGSGANTAEAASLVPGSLEAWPILLAIVSFYPNPPGHSFGQRPALLAFTHSRTQGLQGRRHLS